MYPVEHAPCIKILVILPYRRIALHAHRTQRGDLEHWQEQTSE